MAAEAGLRRRTCRRSSAAARRSQPSACWRSPTRWDVRSADIYVDLARLLGGEPDDRTLAEDPPAKLRLATADLPLEALRSVADFSAYLAMSKPAAKAPPPRSASTEEVRHAPDSDRDHQRRPGRAAYDIYSRLLKDGVVFVRGVIDDDLATTVTAQLLFLENEAPERDIQLYINSPGGSLTAALSSTTRCSTSDRKSATLCTGLAASGSSILLAGGDKGMRMSLPHAQILIHQPFTQASRARRLTSRSTRRRSSASARRWRGSTRKHTGRPLEEVERAMERDFFMTPRGSQGLGLDRPDRGAQPDLRQTRSRGVMLEGA